MCEHKLTGWKARIAATVVLGVLVCSSGSQAESNFVAGHGTVVKGGFRLDPKSRAMQDDRWGLFRHGDAALKVAAPAPAVHLGDAEWKQWRADLITFDFGKLKDRQLLYVYYLSSPKAQKVDAVLEAVEAAFSGTAAGIFWAAIGVEYDTTGIELLRDPDLYRRAAAPVEWTETSYKFIKDEHDPATFAKLVSVAAEALQLGTYRNFAAVEHWSALATSSGANTAALNLESLPPSTVDAYLKAVSKGPLTWLDLKPVASFIALNWKLDIDGVEPAPVLTSKLAWRATGK